MDEKNIRRPAQASDSDLEADYANNVHFAATVWDLKILFGEVSSTKPEVDWHTAITIPWAQAKLMNYFLTVNLLARELQAGSITVPPTMIPPPYPEPTGEENTPINRQFYEKVNELRALFLESQR